jgi:hypothetical protein
MTAQLFNLDAERKARRIGRESQQCVFLAPVRIGASLTKTWLDAISRAQDDLPRWPGLEG